MQNGTITILPFTFQPPDPSKIGDPGIPTQARNFLHLSPNRFFNEIFL
jgi:hypothetical protein